MENVISQITNDQRSILSLVLIDNDEIVRTSWELAADDAKLTILTYASFDDFMKVVHTFKKEIPIYIDSDLGNNVKGEFCAERLFNIGFKEIYLTTGYSPDRFIHSPWLKGIVKKEPPFIFF